MLKNIYKQCWASRWFLCDTRASYHCCRVITGHPSSFQRMLIVARRPASGGVERCSRWNGRGGASTTNDAPNSSCDVTACELRTRQRHFAARKTRLRTGAHIRGWVHFRPNTIPADTAATAMTTTTMIMTSSIALSPPPPPLDLHWHYHRSSFAVY